MIIINKNELNSDLVHDINLELEALFTDNRTWEISSSTGDLDDASDVRIVIKGEGHCYISTISDTTEYVRDLLSHIRAILFGYFLTWLSNKVTKVSSFIGSSISLNLYNISSRSLFDSISIFEILALVLSKIEFQILM